MTAQPTIFVVEDDDSLRSAMCETLGLAGLPVTGFAGGAEAIAGLESGQASLIITDVQMDGMDGYEVLSRARQIRPEVPVVLVTAYGSVGDAVRAIRGGAADYLQKPFKADELVSMASRFAVDVPALPDGLVAADPETLDLITLASRVAGSDATVMISGESGTGKEVFARYIHNHSPRSDGPFVAINCAAIPETMLESILFGYEKGAFTNAYKSTAGKFEQANGGTLLLDEISEMDITLQAKLLRVLQEKEVERLGGHATIPLDVRVLATTNRNLRAAVAEGKFREDLFYRLNVFPMPLPSLSGRPGDILPLAQHFLTRFSEGADVRLSEAAAEKLVHHAWPGNVRELENVMHRAMIVRQASIIEAADILFERVEPGCDDTDAEDAATLSGDLRSREKDLIVEALQLENGNRQNAARRLGISPRTLRYKMARFREDGVALGEYAG